MLFAILHRFSFVQGNTDGIVCNVAAIARTEPCTSASECIAGTGAGMLRGGSCVATCEQWVRQSLTSAWGNSKQRFPHRAMRDDPPLTGLFCKNAWLNRVNASKRKPGGTN